MTISYFGLLNEVMFNPLEFTVSSFESAGQWLEQNNYLPTQQYLDGFIKKYNDETLSEYHYRLDRATLATIVAIKNIEDFVSAVQMIVSTRFNEQFESYRHRQKMLDLEDNVIVYSEQWQNSFIDKFNGQ